MSCVLEHHSDAEVPTTRVLRADSLTDTMLILLTLTIVQRLVGFGRSVLLCRWLDPEQLGAWDMAFGFLMLAAPAAVLGLPGSFRRYTEHFRQRGQLRSFLRHTCLFTALLALLAVAIIDYANAWFSQLVFGRADCILLVRLAAASLALVIAYNVLSELFSSLRLFRLVSLLQFAHSTLFAIFSIGLVLAWRPAAESVVVAYAVACLVCSLAAASWLRQAWNSLPAPTERLSQGTLLAKLMPFAIWIWATDWLMNVFDIVARYMILHYSGLPATEALAHVGNYHSARVVPVLLVTVAGILSSAALPHLSHDWESGHRHSVSNQTNLMFKLITLGLMIGGIFILLAEPLLFDLAFGGKYAGGRTILPLTLTACVWFGVIGIAQNYLWCAERGMLGSVAVLVGLLLNIGLNVLLLPRYGLTGAVAATAAANLAVVATTYLLGVRCGLNFDGGVWVVLALPPLFYAGPWMALLGVVCVAVWAIAGRGILSSAEKHQLICVGRQYLQRVRNSVFPASWPRPRSTT